MATTLLVVGCNGQLGRDMMIAAREAGFEPAGVDFPEVDITDAGSIGPAVAAARPRAVINCAAYTAVDKCESDRGAAFAVNGPGASHCAEASARAGAYFAHISTDYVFDGAKKEPYVETDTPNPKSVYGQSKLEGERLVRRAGGTWAIFRIAWLYGNRGPNFVKTIRKIAAERAVRGEALSVVNDQIGSPTYTMEVCRQVLAAVSGGHPGLFHCTAEGHCSWYDFARTICEAYRIGAEVKSCTTAEFPRPAPRPANSVLENARLKSLGINVMKPWREAFDEFLEEERRIPVSERT